MKIAILGYSFSAVFDCDSHQKLLISRSYVMCVRYQFCKDA